MNAVVSPAPSRRTGSGVDGLDQILGGGLPRHRFYLIEGAPGSGKTTLALHFLMEGRRQGEKGLYVTLSETKQELRDVAESHGWSLDGISLYELESIEDKLQPEEQYTVFHPAEVELTETARRICEQVEEIGPARVVFDSLSEMRLLARDPLRYRRQILALKQFFSGRQCTVLLLDDLSDSDKSLQLQTMSHGVVALERVPTDFGAARRRLQVVKMRGVEYLDGYHDFVIRPGSLEVYPRLVAAQNRQADKPLETRKISSGNPELDALLGGGLQAGTSALITGPAGSGKSTLATLYAHTAAQAGQRVSMFIFEESRETYLQRAAGIGLDLRPAIRDGFVSLQQVDPAELTHGEFAHSIRRHVSDENVCLVVVDSLNGYLNAMPNERHLLIQMHEVLSFLADKGVLTLLALAQHGLVGSIQAPVEFSYIADSVIMLRYFEASGQVKQAISALKQRRGGHERSVREFRITSSGIRIGDPLEEFQGVLTGVPIFAGGMGKLFNGHHDDE